MNELESPDNSFIKVEGFLGSLYKFDALKNLVLSPQLLFGSPANLRNVKVRSILPSFLPPSLETLELWAREWSLDDILDTLHLLEVWPEVKVQSFPNLKLFIIPRDDDPLAFESIVEQYDVDLSDIEESMTEIGIKYFPSLCEGELLTMERVIKCAISLRTDLCRSCRG